jgi:putative PIN family toxin of toxin-antitoxin system
MPGKTNLRIFLDSNVIFSGLHSSSGLAGEILDLFIDNKISVIISQQVLEEVIRTVSLKIPSVLPSLKVLFENVALEIIKDPALTEIERWASHINIEDAAILAAAASIKPDYFITGDRHFYKNRDIVLHSKLNIVTPREFMDSWESDE